MKKQFKRKHAIIFAFILVAAMIVQSPMLTIVNATIPPTSSWQGQGAMAHWDIIDTEHGNASIAMDVVYGQMTTDGSGRSNMVYIRVNHTPQGVSEATGYTANITAGPTWSMDHVSLNATLTFNWTSGFSAHPIAIEWFASPPTVSNSITWQNGTSTYLPGDWRSGNGKTANATIIIGGSGPHPGNFTSNWAAVGQAPTFPAPTNWTGQGAMAHWDIIDTAHNSTPISMDVIYGQQSKNGQSNLIYIKVIHPQGVSEATGYAVNITAGPTWSMNHVSLNATLTFNWTSGYSPHPISIDWYTSGSAIANSITWQNGTSSVVPGNWISGADNICNATMTIGGAGPHPGNFTSDWAAVGQTPQPPTPNWTGQGAIAHWDIVDTAHSNALISMDAFYAQTPAEGSGKTNAIWIKVIHPQGVSEITGYTANITSGPNWSMDHVFINTTLAFNWTSGGLMNHPVTIEWFTAPQSTYNYYTLQNGSIATFNGLWRSGSGNIANATMTIGGAGPHPGNFTSTWAMVGTTEGFTIDQTTLTGQTVNPSTGMAQTSFARGNTIKFAFALQTTGGSGQAVFRVSLKQPDQTPYVISSTAYVSTTRSSAYATFILLGAPTGTWTAQIQIFSTDGVIPLAVKSVTFTVT